MQSSEIAIGNRYGMRLKASIGEPLTEVKVIEKVGRKGHIKVRHLAGETPGLEEYVKTRQIIVAWGERKAFLRDEERLRRAEQASDKEGDRARADATETALFSTGDPDATLMHCGMLSMPAEPVQRIAERAELGSIHRRRPNRRRSAIARERSPDDSGRRIYRRLRT